MKRGAFREFRESITTNVYARTLYNDACVRCERMLLQLQTLPRRRADHHERAVPELHVPQSNVNVLPEGVPLHESDRSGLHGREAAGPVLPRHHLPRGARAAAHLDDKLAVQDVRPPSAQRLLVVVVD